MGKREWEHACSRLAASQYGCIERAQALKLGVSKGAIQRKLTTGSWLWLRPNVFALAGSPNSWHRQLMAATLWAGPGSALSHRTAARLWGLDGFDASAIELTSLRRLRPVESTDLIHRVRSVRLLQIKIRQGLPVTSPERTLLDLAVTQSKDRTEQLLDELLRQKGVTLRQLAIHLARHRTRRGWKILRQLVRERSQGQAPLESKLEQLLYSLIKESGLPPPQRQLRVATQSGTVRLDLAYPKQMLAIEADGHRYHSSRQAWQYDLSRASELTALGWRLLRFTWEDVHRRPEVILDHVDRALAIPSPAYSTGR